MVIGLLIGSLILSSFNLWLTIRSTLPARPMNTPDARNEHIDEDINELLSDVEKERLERDEEFDTRISAIKDELAKQQKEHKGSGISAEEMHPLVRNLPHNIIADKHGYVPDIEVAE